MSRVETAVKMFEDGCACSQAVFGAFAPQFGVDDETAVRIATGFAGGMKMGDTCGAVTGALMVLGLARSDETCRTPDGRQAVGALAVECARRFRERRGALACRDLLGCDISTPEGRQLAQDRNLFRTTCVDAVRDAAAIVDELLDLGSQASV
jgi:C_GCAxxG_C_C family probable redox protein